MAISVSVLLSNEVELEFEDEILLSPQGSAHQKFPEAVSTDDGTLHIVWINELGNNKNVIYCQSTDAGETFSEPIQINQNNNDIVAFIQAGPKIKVRGDELFIIYMDDRSGYTSIYMNRSIDNGFTWGDDILISDQSYLKAYPDMEVGPDGTLNLIYYSYNQNNSFNSVRYTSTEPGSIEFSSSTAVGISNDSQEPCDCCQPDLEISGNGDIYLAYRNNINDIRDTYISIKPSGSDSFNQLIRASFHNDYNNHCPSSGPSMAINDNYIALSYRVSDAANSYINYSDISTLSFDNEVNINSSEASPNFSDIILHNNFIHIGWIDYETGNPDVLYGVSQIGSGELVNRQRINQNIEEGYIMQKDPKLLWHNDKLFYFWSDKRDTFYQLYYRKSISNTFAGDINGDGLLNIQDIILIVTMVLSGDYSTLADMNEDGTVNILDVVLLAFIILNSEP